MKYSELQVEPGSTFPIPNYDVPLAEAACGGARRDGTIEDGQGISDESLGSFRISLNLLNADLELNEAVFFYLNRMVVKEVRQAFGLEAVAL